MLLTINNINNKLISVKKTKSKVQFGVGENRISLSKVIWFYKFPKEKIWILWHMVKNEKN